MKEIEIVINSRVAGHYKSMQKKLLLAIKLSKDEPSSREFSNPIAKERFDENKCYGNLKVAPREKVKHWLDEVARKLSSCGLFSSCSSTLLLCPIIHLLDECEHINWRIQVVQSVFYYGETLLLFSWYPFRCKFSNLQCKTSSYSKKHNYAIANSYTRQLKFFSWYTDSVFEEYCQTQQQSFNADQTDWRA